MDSSCRILVAGATGYVGGKLVNALVAKGHQVRCMARNPKALLGRVSLGVEVVQADVMRPETLAKSVEHIHTAYYLIHSMASKGSFSKLDRIAAQNFTEACKAAGVKRIIYLGGLGKASTDLSKHLRSRQEVGKILAELPGSVIEFRASVVLGSGSLSFEMIRNLVEKLPVMLTPRWVRVQAQPISIVTLLEYLVEALECPLNLKKIYEIGGQDVVSYHEIMLEYAKQRNLKRRILPVPLLSPFISSLWLGLVTPLYRRVGYKLIDSMRNSTVVTNQDALKDFSVHPLSLSESIRVALKKEDEEFGKTRWSDALSSSGNVKSWAGVQFGNRIVESRKITTPLNPYSAFLPIERIGGKYGWYYGKWLWEIRGFLDKLVGGPGVRRGRKDSNSLHVGEAVDFWRVEAVEAPHHLRLFAEMKVPGRAWLEFEVRSIPGGSEIRQTAIFDPVGVLGKLYWYSLFPIHQFVFSGMLRGIKEAGIRAHEEKFGNTKPLEVL